MAYAFKKICVTMAALLGMLAGNVHGDDFSSSYEINENNSCSPTSVTCDPQPCCASYRCGKSFICADFLYLRPYEGGISVCGDSTSADIINPDGTVNSFFKGKRHDPNFKWAPGFRVGAGYELNCWFAAAYWMHFDSKAHRHGNDESHFRWKLDFDVVDVVIGSEYQFGNCLILRPYIGVRGARIDQKARSFEINHEHFITTDGAHNKSRFTSVGGLAGIELNWNIGCGFGIYGNSSISSLWGRFRVKFDDFHTFPGGGKFSTQRDHLEACELVLDSEIGVSWTKCFWNNKQFMIKVGLEQHRYFNHNRIGTYGDLCLAGSFLSAGVEF